MDPNNLTDAEKAAIAKVDGIHSATTPNDPTTVVTPAPTASLIGTKFKTASDLESAYKSLQAELTKIKQGQVPATPATTAAPATPAAPAQSTTDPAITPAPTTEQAQAAVTEAGLDFNKYAQAVAANNGKLPDADYAELEAKGIPRPMVDMYLKGLQATAQDNFTKAHTAAGGEQAFNAARTWAASSLSDAELQAYNAAVSKGGADLELAVTGLVAKWRGAVGQDGTVLLGNGQTPAPAGFATQRDMVNAMKDPRYNKDAAYTREVQAKVQASKGW